MRNQKFETQIEPNRAFGSQILEFLNEIGLTKIPEMIRLEKYIPPKNICTQRKISVSGAKYRYYKHRFLLLKTDVCNIGI